VSEATGKKKITAKEALSSARLASFEPIQRGCSGGSRKTPQYN